MYKARRAIVHLEYEGVDISPDIQERFISFEFTDNSNATVDDFTLQMHDVGDLWKSDWFPRKGDKVLANIEVIGGTEHENNITGILDCGEFWIHHIKPTGFPSVVTISGRALNDTSSIRCEKQSKSWENTTLEQVLADVAEEHGYEYLYDAEEVELDRVEQNKQSGLGFLEQQAEKAGFYIKLTGKQVVIYDDESVKKSKSIITLKRDNLLGYNLDTDTEAYSSCIVKYKDPKLNKVFEYKYNDPDIISCKTLTVERKVKDIGEAGEVARRELQRVNRGEYTGSVGLPGLVLAAGGAVFTLDDFGEFAGKYMIDSAKHVVSGGYTTSLDIHRVSVKV